MTEADRDRASLARRNFFRLVGLGVAAGASLPLAPPAAADSETGRDKRKARYRESDEVKTYYRVNRYPK